MGRLWLPLAWVAVLVLLGSAACDGHAVKPTAQRSPPPSGPIASNLPQGVCAPTYEQLLDPNATRIEAKLVTIATLSAGDPQFPPAWKSPPRSAFFWVVAGAEVFSLDAPNGLHGLGPTAPGTPKPFHFYLAYLQANVDPADPESVAHPCRAIGGELNNGPWPAWFDKMTAMAEARIR